jgi:hypothetical protein
MNISFIINRYSTSDDKQPQRGGVLCTIVEPIVSAPPMKYAAPDLIPLQHSSIGWDCVCLNHTPSNLHLTNIILFLYNTCLELPNIGTLCYF